MKGVKYIVTKIDVYIETVGEINELIFKLSNGDINLNLESDDSDEIKKVFLQGKKAVFTVKINYISPRKLTDKVVKKDKRNEYDTAKEYIDSLNSEIATIETDKNLIELRNKNS